MNIGSTGKLSIMKSGLSLNHFVSILLLSAFVACTRTNIPNTQEGNYVSAAPIGAYPRGWASSFVIGDTVYVGLGYNQTISQPGRLTDWWCFNVNTGWKPIASFPGAPRSNAAAFSIGRYGYVGLGWDGANVFGDFYRYDVDSDKWERKADYPGGARYDAVGFSINGRGYMGTGFYNF